eukprot:CAMPEP_0172409276 /NCGR_PEP_ID=MMETSP1061-20121228/76284_1 /TAXON_ID=37318 /ORGANISM="Pseudo-nitzschia pungens, Strain cf. pungens" /LENGTH=399 /DNA_ID=CAMNT_0013145427 /DNA_START=199 /DNA_END=1399 /DNA_ORIENTATION=-
MPFNASNGRTMRTIIGLSVLVLLSFGTDTAAFSTSTTSIFLSENARKANHGARVSHRPALPGNGNERDDDDDKREEWTPNDLFESIKNFFQPRDKKSDKNDTSQFFRAGFGNNYVLDDSDDDDDIDVDDIDIDIDVDDDDDDDDDLPFFRAGFGNNYVLDDSDDDDDIDVDDIDIDIDVDDDDDDDDDLPAGTSLLLRIPAKQLKPGGLRLFLMFYLMGMQNTPDPNTWRADQKLMSVNVSPKTLPNGMIVSGNGKGKGKGKGGDGYDDDENENNNNNNDDDDEKKYVLEMLYDKDRTGMLQIELLPNEKVAKQPEIRIYRCGSRPSTSYLMQESLIVDGVLDELQNLSGGGSTSTGTSTSSSSSSDNEDVPEIAEEDRLLIPDPETAIVEARDSLAFG